MRTISQDPLLVLTLSDASSIMLNVNKTVSIADTLNRGSTVKLLNGNTFHVMESIEGIRFILDGTDKFAKNAT